MAPFAWRRVSARRGSRSRAAGRDVDDRDGRDLRGHRRNRSTRLLAHGRWNRSSDVGRGAPPGGRPLSAATYSMPLSSKCSARISSNGESRSDEAFAVRRCAARGPATRCRPGDCRPGRRPAPSRAWPWSRRIGALAVRGDFVDHAFLAGAREHVALRIDGQRPDVLVVGIEEDGVFPVAIDFVDPSVRRGGDVKPPSGAGASAWTSSSGASKKTVPLPC